MKARDLANIPLHVGLGLGLAAAVLWWHPAVIPVTFIYFFLREQAQHRYIITGPMPHLSYPAYSVEKRGFFDFGWVTWHSTFEALQGTAGAAVGYALWRLFCA